MDIAILGAGAWGTALAVNLAVRSPARHRVGLWARDAQQAAAMRAGRTNRRYLPQVALPPGLHIRSWSPADAGDAGLHEAVAGADLVVLATPMAALRSMLQQLRACAAPVVWLCKGFEPAHAATDTAPPAEDAPSAMCARPASSVGRAT